MGYLIELEPLTAPFLERNAARAVRKSVGHAWRAILPTALEQDTLLMPDVMAETVVAEAERFLHADLPAGWAVRLAVRAEHLYGANRHFKRTLNRPGNQGRNALYRYLRHWTAGWLQREQNPLFQRLPPAYALGRRLPPGQVPG